MGGIMILNGSPRAPVSNSKGYADIFREKCGRKTEYFSITDKDRRRLCSKLVEASDLLLVFPLYVDSLPAILLEFLKELEKKPPEKKPVISVIINCGFLEYGQNDTAVKMIELFCGRNGYPFGSVLKIGGGEAILGTPFKFLVSRKIKKLASALTSGRYKTLSVTMPLSKKTFIKASTKYWLGRGGKNGLTKEQMATGRIEG